MKKCGSWYTSEYIKNIDIYYAKQVSNKTIAKYLKLHCSMLTKDEIRLAYQFYNDIKKLIYLNFLKHLKITVL